MDGETAAGAEESAPAVPFSYEGNSNHIGAAQVHRNIEACAARGLPMLSVYGSHDETLAICGGAPSLTAHLGAIRAESNVAVVNGVHDLFIREKVPFRICILADAMPELAGMFDPVPGVRYVIASQCDPAVFDKLRGHDVTIWHAYDGGRGEDALVARLWPGQWIVHGGNTAALRGLNLGHMMGFRRFRLYGVDSSFVGQRHAYPWPEDKTDNVHTTITARARDTGEVREFPTTRGLAAQAAIFRDLYLRTFFQCSIEVVGEGLLPFICAELNRQKASGLRPDGETDDTITI